MDPFDCAHWCSSDGVNLDPIAQRQRRCTLPGFWRRWDDQPPAHDLHKLTVYMGRDRTIDPDGYINHRPAEDLSEGCPGGWARCRYASSFMRYIRPSISGGGHDSNPRVDALSADDSSHILDALQYFEVHYARAEAKFREAAK